MSDSDFKRKPKAIDRTLTEQEREFVKLRLTGMPSAEAAKLAGWNHPPTNNKHVQRALAKAVNSQQKKLSGLRLRVIETLMDVAFGDPRELMSWEDGGIDIKKSRDLSPAAVAMVSSVSYDTKGNVKVSFDNKWRAIEMLTKFLLAQDAKEAIKIEGPTGWIEMVREAAIAANASTPRELKLERAEEYIAEVTNGAPQLPVVVDAELEEGGDREPE
jgi:hypothetical protein